MAHHHTGSGPLTTRMEDAPKVRSGQTPVIGPPGAYTTNQLPAVPPQPRVQQSLYPGLSGANAPGPTHPASGPAILPHVLPPGH